MRYRLALVRQGGGDHGRDGLFTCVSRRWVLVLAVDSAVVQSLGGVLFMAAPGRPAQEEQDLTGLANKILHCCVLWSCHMHRGDVSVA